MTDQTADDLAELLVTADIRGTHAAVLDAAQPALQPPTIAVWTDRARANCPGCRQPVAQDMADSCPVTLDQWELRPSDQTHHCGEWLSVLYAQVKGTGYGCEVAVADIERTARSLAEDLSEERNHLRDRTTARLRRELQEALTRLAEPLSGGETDEERADEVSTGTDMEPGVIHQHGKWLAWDRDPVELYETLTVDEQDLQPAGL
ncbi:hypothetical protein [Streptomyces sp. NPDC001787]|uniref:hypothetical protein n=1 Tax=Streptomyces sp. NPDC001787 TaxID=3154523 RepID=UPI00331D4265